MKRPQALITGGAGFVGRHMTDALLARGYDVVTVDIHAMKKRDEDMRQSHWHFIEDVRTWFRKDTTRYDLVVHLAAVVGGRAQIEGDPLSIAVDLEIDAQFFAWCVRTAQKRVVYYSSSAAYPIDLQTQGVLWHATETDRVMSMNEGDIDLDEIRQPDLTYGWAKLTGEMLAQYAEKKDVRVHIFRPFSGYGEDQDLTYPFPSFIQRACEREYPFIVWGTGEQVRDFIHIDDVVECTLRGVEADIEGPTNICTGRPTSFNELAHMVMRRAGYGMYEELIRHMTAQPTGVWYRVGDPEKMLTFFTPTITLEEGIARALNVRRGR